MLLAIHGATLNGTCFDTLARLLAPSGIVFVSIDMRGFGRWYHGDRPFPADPSINYEQTFVDLRAVVKELRVRHPNLPVVLAGECIGATLSTRLAAQCPELVDGLILASPPIYRYSYLGPKTLRQLLLSLANPGRQVDMMPFWKMFVSSDSYIVAERLRDPLGRRYLSLLDLVSSNRVCRQTLTYARAVPANTPALILQGENDRLMKPKGAFLLFSQLGSRDKTLRVFHNHEHLLLETSNTSQQVRRAIAQWLRNVPSARAVPFRGSASR